MFQEAGCFEDIPDLFRCVLRSSPVLCLADILLLVVARFLFLLRDYRFLEALQVVAVLRYPKAETAESDTRIASRAKSVVFLVVALLQALKQLACSGIPWTQVSTVVYLGLYFLDGFLRRVIASAPEATMREIRQISHDNRHWRTTIHTVGAAAIPLHAFFWNFISFNALPKTIEDW